MLFFLFSFLIPSKYHFHRCLSQETDFKSQGVLSCWCVQVQTFTVFCPVHMDWYKHVINFDTRGSGCEAILPVCWFFSGCSEEDQCVSWCGNKGELQCHQCYGWCESFIGLHLLHLLVCVVLWDHDIMNKYSHRGDTDRKVFADTGTWVDREADACTHLSLIHIWRCRRWP